MKNTSRRRRLAPEIREQLIVAEAIRFFAECGFEGGTAELARRLGITQPLLYRYFPTKDALIARVYETYFFGQAAEPALAVLDDATLPAFDRIVGFYQRYISLHSYEAIRLFLFSALAGFTLNQDFFAEFRRLILRRIVLALREIVDGTSDAEITEDEFELAWSLHASIYYVALQRHVHGVAGPAVPDLVEFKVRLFVEGARATLSTILR